MAHAPIVTRRRELSLICLIRRASAGVVIEPSTSETSYGPETVARDISVKCAMWTASAKLKSSSSQSSKLSWQPSQDANFHTASVGRRSGSAVGVEVPPSGAAVIGPVIVRAG